MSKTRMWYVQLGWTPNGYVVNVTDDPTIHGGQAIRSITGNAAGRKFIKESLPRKAFMAHYELDAAPELEHTPTLRRAKKMAKDYWPGLKIVVRKTKHLERRRKK